jgi:hypothetical protein
MIMKQRFILMATIILLSVAALWSVIWNDGVRSASPPPRSSGRDRSPSLHNQGTHVPEYPPPLLAGDSKEEQERKHAEFMNIPIVFYGRVVDQDSRPLPDVTVKPEVKRATNLVEHYSGANPVTKYAPVHTDASGQFVIRGYRGLLLNFGLSKEGYRSWGGGASYDRRLPNCHKPDPIHPVEYMLIREDLPMAEKVFSGRLKWVWNQGTITVDLDPVVGSVTITPTRSGNNPTNKRITFDWSVAMRANGFEMVPMLEERPRIAPTTGYQSGHRYRYSRGDEDWVSGANDLFAIRTTSGQYGLLGIRIFGDGEDNGVCGAISVYLNKSGARNIDHK